MNFKPLFSHLVIALSTFVIFGLSSTANGQSQNQDYRRLSLSVRGGLTMENGGSGFNLLDSRFNVVTENSAHLGLGVQYALTPAWSLEGGYSHTVIRGISEDFETDMNTLSLKNIFNLNQILSINRISNSVNPYLTAGIGYDIYQYQSPGETVDNNSVSYNAGVGLAFKVSQTFDLFAHYEYQIASNRVDNIYTNQQETADTGFGADVLLNLTGGIRINFGEKGTTHPSWRTIPVEVSPSDYENLVSQGKRSEELKQEMSELENHLEQQEQKNKEQINALAEEKDSLNQRVNQLKNDLQVLKDSLAEIHRNPEIIATEGIDAAIGAGHYVQGFASLDLQSAESVRSKFVSLLNNNMLEDDTQVFIAQRQQFYEVLIGVFNDLQKAEEALEIVSKEYNDAFIITFPRPVSLEEIYEGIKRID